MPTQVPLPSTNTALLNWRRWPSVVVPGLREPYSGAGYAFAGCACTTCDQARINAYNFTIAGGPAALPPDHPDIGTRAAGPFRIYHSTAMQSDEQMGLLPGAADAHKAVMSGESRERFALAFNVPLRFVPQTLRIVAIEYAMGSIATVSQQDIIRSLRNIVVPPASLASDMRLRDDPGTLPRAYAAYDATLIGGGGTPMGQKPILCAFHGCDCAACESVRYMAMAQGALRTDHTNRANAVVDSASLVARVHFRHLTDAAYAEARTLHMNLLRVMAGGPVRHGQNLWELCGYVNISPSLQQACLDTYRDMLIGVGVDPDAAAELSDPGTRAPARTNGPCKVLPTGLVSNRFGVELECLVPTRICGEGDNMRAQRFLARALEEAGISSQPENYNHETRSYWKVTTDGSVHGDGCYGAEVVTPILSGFEHLRTAMRAIAGSGARINKSCGVHVHFDARDLSLAQWKRLFILYALIEPAIDKIVPPSRRKNRNQYCQSLRSAFAGGLAEFTTAANNAGSLDRLSADCLRGDRYWKLNPRAWWSHGTVEFRQFGASLNFGKVRRWVILLDAIMSAAKDVRVVLPTRGIEDVGEMGTWLAKAREDTLKREKLATPPKPRLTRARASVWDKMGEGGLAVAKRAEAKAALVTKRSSFPELSPDSYEKLCDLYIDSLAPQLIESLNEANAYFVERAIDLAEAEEWTTEQRADQDEEDDL